MAGFRIGRGRDSRNAQQQRQHPPQGAPPQGPPPGGAGGPRPGPGQYGQGAPRPPYGPGPGQGAPGGAGGPGPGAPYGQQWPPAGGGGRQGEPEYFGDPYGPTQGAGHDPYANNPGHTQSFSVHDPYAQGDGYPDDGYSDGSMYTAGQAPPAGPRLHWKDLLRGIVLRPNATFWQMRDYPVWGPALIVTFLYGLLAVFGLDETRDDVLNATLTSALQYVIGTGVAMVIMGLMLGAVTHTLARQFGGNGTWAPTIGLSMLIMSVSDAPRLLVAMFFGGTASLVQVLGWGTWLAAGALFTSMVSRSHDLPWPKALGASAIQLIMLLALVKLGTL
ncbi:YIP1 family protein [Streptomyces armeniacus]|uniref:YIP1 family protein n=1 Tax=Streptomyces armeniacus TaxID=83291 RepID=A0A345XJG3_9ACTN|nr:Yip1 family protein [Streptomyces armeniacus]AXK31779.1 YIP1 family protein [Streptomyces armeniacus]